MNNTGNKSISNIIIIVLLILIIVLLVLFGTNILYMNMTKRASSLVSQSNNLPRELSDPIIICKNGHKFMIYKSQIIQILDTKNKSANCKDDSLYIETQE